MIRRLTLFTGLAAVALALAGCHGHHRRLFGWAKPETVAATLDCPASQGDLIRVAQSADGRSCAYRRGDTETVDLTLTALDGRSPQVALAPTEAALRALEPSAPASPTPPKPPANADGDGDHASVDAPFVHVDTRGDSAHVKVFGLNINAGDQHAVIDSHWGGKAGPDGAEIRISNYSDGDADLMFLLASGRPGVEGWRSVGYLARGPAAGPLLVATFKTKAAKDQNFHDLDLEQLIRLNLHG